MSMMTKPWPDVCRGPSASIIFQFLEPLQLCEMIPKCTDVDVQISMILGIPTSQLMSRTAADEKCVMDMFVYATGHNNLRDVLCTHFRVGLISPYSTSTEFAQVLHLSSATWLELLFRNTKISEQMLYSALKQVIHVIPQCNLLAVFANCDLADACCTKLIRKLCKSNDSTIAQVKFLVRLCECDVEFPQTEQELAVYRFVHDKQLNAHFNNVPKRQRYAFATCKKSRWFRAHRKALFDIALDNKQCSVSDWFSN